MKLIIFIVAITFIGGIGAAILSEKQRKNSSGETFEKFTSGNSFGSIGSNRPVTAVLQTTQIFIYDNLNSDINVSLNYDKITNIRLTSNKEIAEKSKSVAGRALVGGVILGPIGALLGGMSGIGTKSHTEVKNYILISYKSTDGSEENGILLEVGMNAWDKFTKELQEKANITEEKSVIL